MERTYLRRAIPADVTAITALEERCFDEPWTALAFEQFMEAAGFLVAVEPASTMQADHPLDGRLRGYTVTTASSTNPRTVAHVRNLAVDPSVRRSGIGSHLLTAALGRYHRAGYDRARLEVRASNGGAISLYRRFGFETIDRRPGYYGDGEAAVVMVGPLSGPTADDR